MAWEKRRTQKVGQSTSNGTGKAVANPWHLWGEPSLESPFGFGGLEHLLHQSHLDSVSEKSCEFSDTSSIVSRREDLGDFSTDYVGKPEWCPSQGFNQPHSPKSSRPMANPADAWQGLHHRPEATAVPSAPMGPQTDSGSWRVEWTVSSRGTLPRTRSPVGDPNMTLTGRRSRSPGMMGLDYRTYSHSRGGPSPKQVALNKAISKLGKADHVLDHISNAVTSDVNLNSTNLATALHRIATKGGAKVPAMAKDRRFVDLTSRIQTQLQLNNSGFNARELSNMAWAVAKLPFDGKAILSLIEEDIEHRGISGFNWIDLSNLVWGLATVGYHSPTLFEMIAVDVQDRAMADCCPQAAANIVWSFAKQGHRSDHMLCRFSQHAVSAGAQEFKPMEISSMLWGLAALDYYDVELCDCFQEFLLETEFEGCNMKKISLICWSFAKLKHPCEDLLEMVEEAILERTMHGFNPQNISCIVWAFAVMGYQSEDLFSAAEEQVWKIGLSGFSDQALVDFLWAFASSDYQGSNKAKDTFEMVALHLRKRSLQSMDTRQLSVTAWSFARLGHFLEQPYRVVEKEFMQRGAESFSPEERYFLLEAFHAYRSNLPAEPQSPDSCSIGLQVVTALEGEGGDFDQAPAVTPPRTPPRTSTKSTAEFTSPGSGRKHKSESGSWARPMVPADRGFDFGLSLQIDS